MYLLSVSCVSNTPKQSNVNQGCQDIPNYERRMGRLEASRLRSQWECPIAMSAYSDRNGLGHSADPLGWLEGSHDSICTAQGVDHGTDRGCCSDVRVQGEPDVARYNRVALIRSDEARPSGCQEFRQ